MHTGLRYVEISRFLLGSCTSTTTQAAVMALARNPMIRHTTLVDILYLAQLLSSPGRSIIVSLDHPSVFAAFIVPTLRRSTGQIPLDAARMLD